MDMKEFINEECPKCKNKNTQLCEIVYNIDGEAQCQYFINQMEVLE